MSDTTTIQVKRRLRTDLENIRDEYELASLSDVIELLLAQRQRDSDLNEIRESIATMQEQIAYLLEQIGGADEGHSVSE